jgi:hypothetical protein
MDANRNKRQHVGISLTVINCGAGEPKGLRPVLLRRCRPGCSDAIEIEKCSYDIRGWKIRVDCKTFFEQAKSFRGVIRRRSVGCRQRPQVVIVGIHVFGAFPLRSLDLGVPQLWFNGADHTFSDTVLQLEDIIQQALDAVGPDVSARCGIYELSNDANAVSSFANTAFQDATNAKFTRDIPYIRILTLEREGRSTRGND